MNSKPLNTTIPNNLSYYQHHSFCVQTAGVQVSFVSKPGLPEWNVISPKSTLLATYTQTKPGSRTLLLGCGHGALGALLAIRDPESRFWAADDNIIAYRMTERTAAINQLENLHPLQGASLPNEMMASFDQVVIETPKSRVRARAWLIQAWRALRQGGILTMAGANQEGIHAISKDAKALFGNAQVLGYKKGCRVVQCTKSSHTNLPAWALEPGLTPDRWHEFDVQLGEHIFRVRTLAGVFSFRHVDEGTRLLLDYLSTISLYGETVLDLGCGYGILGLEAARLGAAWVDLSDIDFPSIACAQENLALNQIHNANAFGADLLDFAIPGRYSIILSNPPFHTGKAVNYQVAETLIVHAHHILPPGGRLILVANRFIRYDRLASQVFGKTRIIAQTNKYQITACER